ncbi:MAG TPA: DUF6220 domain-containing protein [Anaerolineales bacterium]
MNESANRLFRILVWLFLIAIFAQLFLAGMVAVAEELKDWSLHAALGHMLAFILIPMLIIMYVGQASREVKLLTWVLFAVWFVQVYVLVILLRESMPVASALHPVLALIDFWLALRLLGASKLASAN